MLTPRLRALGLILALSLLGCGDSEAPIPAIIEPPGPGGAAGTAGTAAAPGGSGGAPAGAGGAAGLSGSSGQSGAAGADSAGQGGASEGGAAGEGGEAGSAGASAGGESGGSGQAGAAGSSGGAGGSAGEVEVSAAAGPLSLTFDVELKGKGSQAVGAVSIAGAVGTVEIEGKEVAAVVYEKQAWPEFGYDLFQTLAVEEGRWHILWFYCQGDQITGLYRESTDGTPVIYEPASGSCVSGPTSVAEVSLPASKLPMPKLLDGFTVQGEKINLEPGQPGWLQLGEKMTVLPFNTVDCTKDCGANGWWELHSLLWTPEKKRACFAIFYLFPGKDGTHVTYSLSLPDLSDPVGSQTLEATWKGPEG